MSLEYVEKRILEALRLSSGNTLRARQQIISWTYEDPELLQSLAGPHLSGIVAYNIERVASGRSARTKAKNQAPPPQKAQSTPAKREENFGMDLLRAVAGSDAAIFGFDNGAPAPKRGQASQRHINAIHQMVAKSKTKKT